MILIALDERIHDGIELIAQEDRNDGWRRFIGTKTVIVACRSNRHAQELLVFVDRFDHAGEEHEKTQVVDGIIAGIEQVHVVVRKRPVVVLA